MKVTKSDKTFKPVTLEVTLETQEELDGFARMFNHVAVINAFKAAGIANADRIKHVATSEGAEIYSISWAEFEDRIDKYIKN